MARPPSTKAVAHKIARDPKMSTATRLQAALTARPHTTDAQFARLLRMLIATGKRGPVIRECLKMLAEIEEREQVNRIFADEKRRLQNKKENA